MNQVKLRMTILRLVTVCIVGILIYNLFHIQVIEGRNWADMADNNRFRHLEITAPRGKIISSDGVELAANIPRYDVALADEQDSIKREQAIDMLSQLLDLDVEDIQDRLAKAGARFKPAVIESNVDFETVLMLEEHRHLIPGLEIQTVPQRVYPQKTVLAHVLGRLIDGRGAEGLEYQWEEHLGGKDGFSVVQVNAAGRPVEDPVNSQPAVPGSDLHLTIDAGLQQAIQESMQRVLEKLRENYDLEDAWSGGVVVTDPNTGSVLAMVSEPSFDNNKKYSSSAWDANLPESSRVRSLSDRTINTRSVVGSTFKMLTGMAALENGHVTPNERIYDPGVKDVAGFTVRNYGRSAYGNIDMRRALQVSSNVYFGTMGNRVGREQLYEYIDKFGMTGLAMGDSDENVLKNAGFTDLSRGEQVYSLDYYKDRIKRGTSFYPGDLVQSAYGQRNEFTVMQMANYVSMLANGGTHYRPHIVREIVDANGETVELFPPEVLAEQDFDSDAILAIREGMRAAASGSRFRDLPFAIAGKTGTAEEWGWDNHAWWVGYAPYDEPEIAIAIHLDYGGLGLRSEEVARDIIDYYFDLE